MEKERENKPTEGITPQIDFYTLEHIEKVWNIGIRYLREKIKDGSLPAKTVGKKYMVLHSDLLAFIKSGGDALENKAKSNLPKKIKDTEG